MTSARLAPRRAIDSITVFGPEDLDPAVSAQDRDDPAYVPARGVIDGVAVGIVIAPLGGRHYVLLAEVADVDFTGVGDTVPVSLTIGNDSGTTAAYVKKNKFH